MSGQPVDPRLLDAVSQMQRQMERRHFWSLIVVSLVFLIGGGLLGQFIATEEARKVVGEMEVRIEQLQSTIHQVRLTATEERAALQQVAQLKAAERENDAYKADVQTQQSLELHLRQLREKRGQMLAEFKPYLTNNRPVPANEVQHVVDELTDGPARFLEQRIAETRSASARHADSWRTLLARSSNSAWSMRDDDSASQQRSEPSTSATLAESGSSTVHERTRTVAMRRDRRAIATTSDRSTTWLAPARMGSTGGPGPLTVGPARPTERERHSTRYGVTVTNSRHAPLSRPVAARRPSVERPTANRPDGPTKFYDAPRRAGFIFFSRPSDKTPVTIEPAREQPVREKPVEKIAIDPTGPRLVR